MNDVLLTGFEPFGRWPINSSAQVAGALDSQIIRGRRVHTRVVPVAYGGDTGLVLAAIESLRPRLVLCLGLNASAAVLEVERFAVNLRTPDSAGISDSLVSILDGGPGAYFSTLDPERAAAAIRTAGTPARPHCFAGAYLCNHLFYQVLHHLRATGGNQIAGFIHLPLSTTGRLAPGVDAGPSMEIDRLVAGVTAAIVDALDTAE